MVRKVNTMKKAVSLLLCVMLCLGLCIPALGAYNEDVTVSATLDQAALDYNADSPQTVVCTVKLSKEVQLYSVALQADVASGLTLAGISSDIALASGSNYSLTTGKVGWFGENTATTNLVILTVTVPAGTAAGTYQIGVKDIELATAGENNGDNWMEGGTAYATLTINGDVASTGAKLDKTTASVGVGGSVTLTASLLPDTTNATISAVSWESADTAVATVDTTGKVTGVAEGSTTITAHVTASDNTTPWDATCTVTVTKSPYTVSVKRDGTGVVHAGDEVTMNVSVSGAAYAGVQATVTYDTDVFTYTSGSGDATLTAGTGSIEIYYNGDEKAANSNVAVLVFTAKEPTGDTTDGVFGFSYAKACSAESALDGTGDSAKDGDTVTVTKQYTVKFMDKDGTQIGSDVKVDAGGSLTDVPDAPAVDYNDFNGWSDGTTTYADADAVKALTISKDTTFTATYKAKTFTVTLADGLTGDKTATYGVAYEVTITSYNSVYNYTVTYTINGTDYTDVTDNKDGTFTIPGTGIIGDMSVTFTKKVNAEVNVYANYVTGYTLITVSSDGTAYKYGENAMYYITEKSECAWLVEGSVTKEAAAALVDTTTAHAGTITFSNDLNGDGKVDIDDAVVVNSVLNKRYTVSTNMAVYLRANVNAYDSYKIDAADINAIITDASYVK